MPVAHLCVPQEVSAVSQMQRLQGKRGHSNKLGKARSAPDSGNGGQRGLHPCFTDIENGGFPVGHGKESLLFHDTSLNRRKLACFFSC